MISRKVKIQNKDGIHVRPSTVILQSVKGYKGSILLKAKGMEAELNSPTAALGLLAMGLKCGESAEIAVSGDNEQETADKMAELFERHYDFPPRA